MMEIETKSAKETQNIAAMLARELDAGSWDYARVVALEGNLGAGKTTFVQGFAAALGIKEPVKSPTFLVMKIYAVQRKHTKHLVHIDCYRLDDASELAHLGFDKLLADRDAIIIIEWADRIKKILSKERLTLLFSHVAPTRRQITIPEL